jgi:hypothetical protein
MGQNTAVQSMKTHGSKYGRPKYVDPWVTIRPSKVCRPMGQNTAVQSMKTHGSKWGGPKYEDPWVKARSLQSHPIQAERSAHRRPAFSKLPNTGRTFGFVEGRPSQNHPIQAERSVYRRPAFAKSPNTVQCMKTHGSQYGRAKYEDPWVKMRRSKV